MTKTIVKLGDLEEAVLALVYFVDHVSKINLLAKILHQKGRWPIDVDHSLQIQAANMLPGDLYGACANVKVTIGDVSDEQNCFIQEHSSYSLILGQPYIMAMRMETKVLDDEGLSSYKKLNELTKWKKQYVSGMQSELQGRNVLDLDDVIIGVFEEISNVDMMSKLEEIKQTDAIEDAIDVQVETKYKTAAKKVKPMDTPLLEGSNGVIEEASCQPMLKDPKNIGHKFTEETLKQLKIGKDGFLTTKEIKCFHEMLMQHGKAFAFESNEIGTQAQYIIVATDYSTKWAEARATRKYDARTTAAFLYENVFTRYGLPIEIVSDKRTHFLNEIIEYLLSDFMVIHNKSAPYHPQVNGQAEHTNKILSSVLTKVVSTGRTDWEMNLHAALWAYRVSFKTTLNVTPFNLVYGLDAILPIEFLLLTLRVAKDLEWIGHELSERLEDLEKLDEQRLTAVAHIYAQKRK
ncbi:hypothetical protein L7F22_020968 [Adiantum nelumboides]|nr:hypothetical protein [Adiantum nelumboides]